METKLTKPKPPTLALLRAVAKRAGILRDKHGAEKVELWDGYLIDLRNWRPDLYAAHAAPLAEAFQIETTHDGNHWLTLMSCHWRETFDTWAAAAWAAAVAHHEREKGYEKIRAAACNRLAADRKAKKRAERAAKAAKKGKKQ